ncbi:hypothetical protein BJ912DRAFT_1061991 [Pholiota molesta]|nr:hypothetical protein BJ912DRAFT_1061991 [Pholiota molesta]
MATTAVTGLNNFCQALHWPVPTYDLTSSGPQNQTVHQAKVLINGIEYGEGTGTSKNAAKEAAAAAALAQMRNEHPEYTF